MSRLTPLLFALLAACGGEAPKPTEAPKPAEPSAEAPKPAEPAPAEAPKPVDPAAAPAAAPAAPRVNLNTASKEAIGALPDMTPKMVHEFEEYRPYVSVVQFRKEIGKYVSAEQVAKWEPLVFVPIDPNKSDATTLQQIPGVDAAKADALIAGRPYADAAAFLARLDASQADAAKALLAQ